MKQFQLLKIIWLSALLLLTVTGRASTGGEESMVNLTLNEGLAGETVHSVMTDHSGGTWIATNSGVNVYNGKQLNTFPLTGDDGQSLVVYDLCETPGWQVYAATDRGLYRIACGSDHAEHVLPEVKSPISLLAVGDTVFIGSEQGLLFFDGHKLHHTDVDVSRQGLDNIVRQYDKGDDGLIWFLSRFDLNSYDPRTGKTHRYKMNLPVEKPVLTQFACLGKQRFAVGTRGNGLFVCDLAAGTAERVEGVGNIVSTVKRSSDGYICVATDGAGAYLLEVGGTGGGLVIKEHFFTDGDALHRLPSNGTYCYYRDQNGVNWFGFVRYGLVHTYYNNGLFKPFSIGGFTTEGMNVRTYCRHDDDMVRGLQNGFYYVNAQTGEHRMFTSADLGGGHIVNSICWHDGRFYIGTFDGGLHVFDAKTRVLSRQAITPMLDDCSIGELKSGPDGRLWIGCGHGLMIVDDGRV